MEPNTKRTSNSRTELPGTTVSGLTGSEKLNDHGATVLKPSSAFSATWGSLKSSGSATGMLMVRSSLPESSRLIGNGRMPSAGAKFAVMTSVVGEPSGFVVGDVGSA